MNVEPIGILRDLTADEREKASASGAIETAAAGRDLASVSDHSHALITAWVANGKTGGMATRVVRISGGANGRLLVDGAGWPAGTAILSIEGYSPAEHSVFSASDGRSATFPADRPAEALLADMIREAARFHGESCAGVILGAKVVLHMMQTWRVGQRDPRLRLWLGSDGCIGDAIMALTGITLGTSRLKVPGGRIYRFVFEDKGLAYYPTDEAFAPAAEVIGKDIEQLFAIREETQRAEQRKPVHDKSAPRRSKEEEALIQKVLDSLVDGKLSCAMSYKIAAEMGVHVSEVGRAADEARVKISLCQLGCFR